MKYASRIDTWLISLVIAILLLPLLTIFAVVEGMTSQDLIDVLAVLAVILGVSAAVMYVLLWPCYYTFEASHLHVRCGLVKLDIPYSSIRSAEKSNNPLSAPALSLKRIRIEHNKGFTLISPKNRKQFIQLLMEKVAQCKSDQGMMA